MTLPVNPNTAPSEQDKERLAEKLAYIEWNGRHTLRTCMPSAAIRMREMAATAIDFLTKPKAGEQAKLWTVFDMGGGWSQIKQGETTIAIIETRSNAPQIIADAHNATLTGEAEDTKKIDWLQSHRSVQVTQPSAAWVVMINPMNGTGPVFHHSKDLREAIDAAMKASDPRGADSVGHGNDEHLADQVTTKPSPLTGEQAKDTEGK